jgi:nucleoside 2-deoxyribosyltransferase
VRDTVFICLSAIRPAQKVRSGRWPSFVSIFAALADADAVVAVCDGPQVDDGTAWEIGYAYGRNIPIYGLRTDRRLVQQVDERINLMILESLNELSDRSTSSSIRFGMPRNLRSRKFLDR